MADLIVLVPALFAVLAAWDGSRAARALLVSLALAYAADWGGLEFHPILWACLDAAVAVYIMLGKMSRSDIAIVVLFFPALMAYTLPYPYYMFIPNMIVGVQFLLTFPAIRLSQRLGHVQRQHGRWSDFELRVRHDC